MSQGDLFSNHQTNTSVVTPDILRSVVGGEHSPAGGSNANQWMHCLYYVLLWLKSGVDLGSSPAQRRGTACHHILEIVKLSTPEDALVDEASKFIGTSIGGHLVTAEDIEIVVSGISNQQKFWRHKYGVENPDNVIHEIKVSPPKYKWAFGTIDFALLEENLIYAGDFKTGLYGVDPAKTWQIIVYVVFMSCMPEYADYFKPGVRIIVGVNQPTAANPIKEHEIDFEEFTRLRDKVLARLEEIEQGIKKPATIEPVMGPHCKHCNVKAVCPGVKAHAEKAVTRDPKQYRDNPEKLGDLLALALTVKGWASDVEKYCYALAKDGYEIGGHKLVQKRQTRIWADTDAAAEKLAALGVNEIFDQKLISPAKAEAALKKLGKSTADLEGLIEARTGGTTLVPTSDRRSAAQLDRESD